MISSITNYCERISISTLRIMVALERLKIQKVEILYLHLALSLNLPTVHDSGSLFPLFLLFGAGQSQIFIWLPLYSSLFSRIFSEGPALLTLAEAVPSCLTTYHHSILFPSRFLSLSEIILLFSLYVYHLPPHPEECKLTLKSQAHVSNCQLDNSM